jgi:hypothetical protein
MDGELYEVKLATLLFARGLNRSEDFHIASNMRDAGRFDDIVLRLGHQTLFIQLKHKQIVTKEIKLPTTYTEKGNIQPGEILCVILQDEAEI